MIESYLIFMEPKISDLFCGCHFHYASFLRAGQITCLGSDCMDLLLIALSELLAWVRSAPTIFVRP
jgi:hypothetical protein